MDERRDLGLGGVPGLAQFGRGDDAFQVAHDGTAKSRVRRPIERLHGVAPRAGSGRGGDGFDAGASLGDQFR